MADLDDWREGTVDLATKWKSVMLSRKALIREPWAIHVDMGKRGGVERRLSHLPTGGYVVAVDENRCSDVEAAELARRLDRLEGIDWSTSSIDVLMDHRKRVRGVIQRWKSALSSPVESGEAG